MATILRQTTLFGLTGLLFAAATCSASFNVGKDVLAKSDDDELHLRSVPEVVDETTMGNSSSDSTCKEKKSSWVGFLCAAVAVVFLGITFIPVKEVTIGDGMFFQVFVTLGTWLVGMVIYLIRGCPVFHPLAMLGGVVWATGNITVVPIVRMVGLGLAVQLWGATNMIFGWASSRFGILGVSQHAVCSSLLNSAGVIFCAASLFVYLFVKSESKKVDGDTTPLLAELQQGSSPPDTSKWKKLNRFADEDQTRLDDLSPCLKRVVGYSLAVGSGVLYGINFNPVAHLIHKQQTTDPDSGGTFVALDYVFSHWTGIFSATVIYFVIYCLACRGRPQVFQGAVLPGVLTGAIWGVADASWFIANERLSQAIAYPIITTGPSVIAALLGVVYYCEIKGRKNILFFCAALCLAVVGVLAMSFSKTYRL